MLFRSAISANLGVNPALTITAQAERAMALWPNKGDKDPRPPLGAAYQRAAPATPRNPIVPSSAPAALRLPIGGPLDRKPEGSAALRDAAALRQDVPRGPTSRRS